LSQGLRTQKAFDEETIAAMIPVEYRITLRYGVFGSFYGCGPRRSPWTSENAPDAANPAPAPPSHFLLNVMLVVEKMD
jgi:hypothetical protein